MEECRPITTMEEAEKPIGSAILPISGLRRDQTNKLTDDAIKTVFESLRSRGIDISNPELRTKIVKEGGQTICAVNEQYQYLLRTIIGSAMKGEQVSAKIVELALEKNQMIMDLLTISRQLETMSSTAIVEGYQTSTPSTSLSTILSIPIPTDSSGNYIDVRGLQEQKMLLETKSYTKLRKHAVQVTEEKNRMASNQLALYGFLNLVAIGLLLYISSAK
jgi:hypothetical protein